MQTRVTLTLILIISAATAAISKPSPAFSDSSWKQVGAPGFSAGMVYYTSLAFSPAGEPFVAYMDFQNGQKATVKKFNGTSWVTVGNEGFSSGQIWYMDLIFGPQDGFPYVIYADLANSGKATVMKFNGTNWVYVGTPDFSDGHIDYPDLCFSPSGQLYASFMDAAHSLKATVMKFDGTNWVNVGTPGFSAEAAWYSNIEFNPVTGEPYVGFGNVEKGTVMKFNGTNWVVVGSPGFTVERCPFFSMAFSPNGQPYVAYKDFGTGQRTTVMKFNGSSWVNVGNPGFSSGHSTWQKLVFNQGGEPCVSFNDSLYAKKGRVMRFDGSSWVDIGTPGFTAGEACYTNLAFHPNGKPYMAYMDLYNGWKASVMRLDTTCIPTAPIISGSNNLCVNSGYYDYQTNSGMTAYQWTTSPGGTITFGQGTSTLQVFWTQSGSNWVAVNFTNSQGCRASQPTVFPVMVNPLPQPAGVISGISEVCAGTTGVQYSVVPITNAVTYVWDLPQGAIISSGVWTNSILVDFNSSAVSGDITVYGNNLCGNGILSPPYQVVVKPIPQTPTIILQEMLLISSAPHGNQWYRDGILLINDTNQTCFPNLPGEYWTIVTIHGCISDSSNHVFFNPVGINVKQSGGILLFPNPAMSLLHIQNISPNEPILNIQIFNFNGVRVLEKPTTSASVDLQIDQLHPGLYTLKATGEHFVWYSKFLKL